ncbi:MAG: protein kinase, partial [Deltaproteobacteria bacterium]|nr:protein kinase [Deltaproteobacteria bacterium]
MEISIPTYFADKVLGEGAWGKVYLVHNSRAEHFALKVLKAGSSPASLRGLEEEVRILSKLSHPNLVGVFQYLPRGDAVQGVTETGPGFLMEWVEETFQTPTAGKDLEGLLNLFTQALRAMEYLHERRILHGDLKPSHLRRTKKGKLKLLDFGFASEVRTESPRGPVEGTFDYMAPEALSGRRAAGSDLFALAAIFYEALTGHLPYPNRDLAQRFSEPPASVGEVSPEVPTFFAAILQRMLEPDPLRRFTSAAAVRRALEIAQPSSSTREPASAASPRLPFVGRDRLISEWEDQTAAWERGETKAPLWILQGRAGMGKSRVMEELAWQASLRDLTLCERRPGESWEAVIPDLEKISGLSLLMVRDLHLLPEAELLGFEKLFGSLKARAPRTALLLEYDPDRSSSALLSLLESARDSLHGRNILVAAFDRAESDLFLQEILWEQPLSEAFRHAAFAVTQGSPALLFRLAREAGGPSAWERMSLPESLAASLTARCQDLSMEEKALLLACTLLPGGTSTQEYPTSVSPRRLHERGLLVSEEGKVRVAVPLHRLFLQGIFSHAERREVAVAIFLRLRGTAPEDADSLARLARVAGRDEDFLDYAGRAAEDCLTRGDAEAAAGLYREMLEVAETGRDRAFAYAHLAATLSRLARFEEAAEAYEHWYATAEDDGSGVQTLKYHYLLGLNFLNQGKLTEATQRLQQALHSGDPARFASHLPFSLKVLALLASIEERQGRRDAARRHYEVGLALNAEPSPERTQLLRQRGMLQLAEGEAEAGRASLEAALRMSLDLDYEEGVANTGALLADLAQRQGDYDRALRIHEQVLKLAEKQQDPLKQARTHSNMSSVLIELADYAHASEHIEKAETIFATLGNELDRLIHRFHAVTIQTYLGHPLAAESELHEVARRLGQGEIQAYLERLKGESARLQRDFQGALEAYVRARKAFLHAKRPEEADLCLLQEIFTECLAGDLEAARSRIPESQGTAPWQPFFRWIESLLAETPHMDASALQERLQSILVNGQQELVLLALLAGAEVLARCKQAEAAETLRQKAFEWLEALYRGLPEEMQLSFEQREDYRRLAEARLKRLKVAGLSRERFLSFAKINKRLSEERDMRAIHEQVMDAAMALAGAERGFLLVRQEAGEGQLLPGFRVEAARNMKKENLSEEEFKISLSVVSEALRRRVSLLTDDAQADPSFRHAESVHRYELKSILALPLVGSSGCLGVLYLDHRFEIGAFSEEKLLFLKAFADQSVLAIEKAKTLAELAEAKLGLEHRVEDQAQRLERMELELHEARMGLKFGYEEIIGQSPKMMKVLGLLDRITDTRVPVWIHGESGTGKELIARALHFNSDRKARPFIAENCSAIP